MANLHLNYYPNQVITESGVAASDDGSFYTNVDPDGEAGVYMQIITHGCNLILFLWMSGIEPANTPGDSV